MKRLIICLMVGLFLAACKKLESKDFYLENNCQTCEKSIKKAALAIKGIYYADYEWEVGKLIIKYDPNEFKSGLLYDELQKAHFIRKVDSLNEDNIQAMPVCCQQ